MHTIPRSRGEAGRPKGRTGIALGFTLCARSWHGSPVRFLSRTDSGRRQSKGAWLSSPQTAGVVAGTHLPFTASPGECAAACCDLHKFVTATPPHRLHSAGIAPASRHVACRVITPGIHRGSLFRQAAGNSGRPGQKSVSRKSRRHGLTGRRRVARRRIRPRQQSFPDDGEEAAKPRQKPFWLCRSDPRRASSRCCGPEVGRWLRPKLRPRSSFVPAAGRRVVAPTNSKRFAGRRSCQPVRAD